MSKTRFMTVLFSATEKEDEELTQQVANDIQSAKENGSFEDDEMSYNDLGDGRILAKDKGTDEYTMIHTDTGDSEYIDLEEVPEFCVEGYLHPEVLEESGSAVVNPMAEKEFSVTTNNTAVLKIFSDQNLVEAVTESVSKSEQDAQIGDLKFEKDSNSDGVIVTDMSSGDKAKVELDGPDMKVTELDQKNFKSFSNTSNKDMNIIRRKVFSNAEQYEPIYVIGIDPINKVLVNSPVYGEVAAQELVNKLTELGLVGLTITDNPDEGREYALQLLESNGAVEVAEAEEATYSDNGDSVICNRYFSDRTRFMNRLFSEAEENVSDHQEIVEDAIKNGDQLETEEFIITPVSSDAAVVEDKDTGEYTVAEIDGEDINVESISDEEAEKMMSNVVISKNEKNFSNKPYTKVDQRSYAALAITEKAGVNGKEGIGKKALNLVKKNPKLATAVAATVATAGAGAVAASKMSKKEKQKENSDTEDATLAQIEDSATEAIQNVQEAAETAIQAIDQAKETPVDSPEDVKEATYSDKLFSEADNKSLSTLKW